MDSPRSTTESPANCEHFRGDGYSLARFSTGKEACVSDMIADLRRQMQERLKEIERELNGLEDLTRERAQIEAALARPPFTTDGRQRPQRAAAPAKRAPSRRAARPRAPRGA